MGTIASGTPSWVDLGSPDLEATKRFYGELFGWTADTSPDPRFGGYTIFNKDGKPVAGAGPLMAEGQPTVWSTYVSTDDADAVAALVEEHGGKVVMPPMDIAEQGRMAVFSDPAGAHISVWQPGLMPGAAVFNVPGALSWNELHTRDPQEAKAFYGAVFDWGANDMPFGDVTYTMWQLDGRDVGGMMPMSAEEPAEHPPYWLVYFAVADCDATAAKATAVGGDVLAPPVDIPAGRFAVLRDPQKAVFGVIQLPS